MDGWVVRYEWMGGREGWVDGWEERVEGEGIGGWVTAGMKERGSCG